MIKYSISKHNDKYVLWKESKTEHGFACKGIFQGTKKECKDKLKEAKK